ncbi:hypothetical protein L596_000025 [Steinernema carpocapsae]|uniref:Uncharacterized protein n=1 Tax=Steinernema carpocapsae TaxID=34508 RepID=A0A4U8UGN7_STECR|nr:hypothetical protein L596_000025 [Steinernema carpocapsae]
MLQRPDDEEYSRDVLKILKNKLRYADHPSLLTEDPTLDSSPNHLIVLIPCHYQQSFTLTCQKHVASALLSHSPIFVSDSSFFSTG